ncbi:MAG TPA: MFS transporter [Ktedonobacterales bacterium]|nr:MFS transporter [Ktedonobacterales bacterium]
METAASIPGGVGTFPALRLPHRRVGELVAISIFWFAINFHWAALLQLVIPGQVYGLLFHAAPAGTLAERASWADGHSPLALAIVLAPGLIVALLANPFFGLLSDRTPGRFGRRRPYILGGTALNVIGLGLMAFAPLVATADGSGNVLAPSLLILMAALMVTQLANNAAAAPFHALLPDMVAEEQRGAASGIMGLALFLGQIGGAIAPTLIGFSSAGLKDGTQTVSTYDQRIALSYGAVALVVVVMAILTALTVHEQPWTREQTAQTASSTATVQTGRSLMLTIVAVIATTALLFGGARAILGNALNANLVNGLEIVPVIVAGIGAAYAFDFRPRRDPDFSWVVLTRMLVMLGIYSVQVFIFLYMHDIAAPDHPEAATTEFLVILTVTALISSLIAGRASDRFGRKRMVYISGAFMAAVGAAFILAPLIVPGNILALALVAAAIFGLGYGAYVSVDWALVADVLPREETYARDMGVWNIGLTIPQVIAAVLGAALITLGQSILSHQYSYSFLFVSLVVFCVLGTVTVRYIKGVKR